MLFCTYNESVDKFSHNLFYFAKLTELSEFIRVAFHEEVIKFVHFLSWKLFCLSFILLSHLCYIFNKYVAMLNKSVNSER